MVDRIEYMSRLASLLQDIPQEERLAAMQYYNGYFDDAGKEREQQVIGELGDPEQVAAEIKAGLRKKDGEAGEEMQSGEPARGAGSGNAAGSGGGNSSGSGGRTSVGTASEYSYGNPGGSGGSGNGSNGRSYPQYGGQGQPKKKPWTSKIVIAVLVVLILLIAAPAVLPVLLGILAVILAIGVAVFAVFIALVILSAAAVLVGVVVFFSGAFLVAAQPAAALSVMGIGLILTAIGAVATVASVRLCIIVLPGLFRFAVELCRKPFHRRREAT